MSDNINPDHYKRLPAEAIDIIESMIEGAPDNKAAYLHGQAAKYDLRLWAKGKSLEDFLSDWGKHIWYALRLESHLLELIEKQKSDETQKASDLQSHKEHPFGEPDQPKWTPKLGDWVRIKKPGSDKRDSVLWSSFMDEHDKEVVQVKEIKDGAMVHGEWFFPFEWLEPAEQPKPTLNSDTIPEGYRKLKNSSIEPRQRGDLRWSIAEKRYIEIGFDEIGYANRENWAACRKITEEVTGEVEPPDGWRFLEVGEVIRKGDRFFNGDYWKDRNWGVGETYSTTHQKTIRRNEFKVDEKVVYTIDNTIWTFKSEIDDGPRFPKSAWVTCVTGIGKMSQRICVNHLAPYIEDAKPTTEVAVEGTVEVKPLYGWRWLEVGEVFRKGDTTNTIEPISEHWVGTQCVVKHVALRRNRFEVGEKVVAKDSHEIWEVDSLVNGVYQLKNGEAFYASFPEHLAPYIEETT